MVSDGYAERAIAALLIGCTSVVVLAFAKSVRADSVAPQERRSETEIDAPAEQQLLTAAIEVSGSDGCLTTANVVAEVAVWLRRNHVHELLHIRLHVGDTEVRFEVFDNERATGDRRFHQLPLDCPHRMAVVGLAIAFALDDTLMETVDLGRDGSDTLRASLALEGGFGFDVLAPSTALGAFRFELGFDAARLRLGLIVGYGLPTALGTGQLHTALVAGQLNFCAAAPWTPIGLVVCAGALAGVTRAEGSGYLVNGDTSLPWVAASARTELQFQIAQTLRLTLAAEGLVPIVRPTWQAVTVSGSVTAARTASPIGLALVAGAEVEFN